MCWQLFLAAHLFLLRRPIHIDGGESLVNAIVSIVITMIIIVILAPLAQAHN